MARNNTTRKPQFTYYFSVEGETEYWYLKWLQEQINSAPGVKCKVKLDPKVEKDPVSYVKGLVIHEETVVWHLSDIEGSNEECNLAVQNTISRLKQAAKLGKNVKYHFGYSNLSFDLWMILHTLDCNSTFDEPGKYLRLINRGFDERFESMDKYKQEDNFKRCLKKLSLDDVRSAIARAQTIMQRIESDGYVVTKFKGYAYYLHNPSLEIYQVIYQILKKCGLE